LTKSQPAMKSIATQRQIALEGGKMAVPRAKQLESNTGRLGATAARTIETQSHRVQVQTKSRPVTECPRGEMSWMRT